MAEPGWDFDHRDMAGTRLTVRDQGPTNLRDEEPGGITMAICIDFSYAAAVHLTDLDIAALISKLQAIHQDHVRQRQESEHE